MHGELVLSPWCWVFLLFMVVFGVKGDCWKEVACLEERDNMVGQVRGLTSTSGCQETCVQLKGCEYFTYYAGTVVSGETWCSKLKTKVNLDRSIQYMLPVQQLRFPLWQLQWLQFWSPQL